MKNSQHALFYVRTKGLKHPRAVIIPYEDQIIEKDKDGRMVERTIRYIKGEPEIYKSEQPEGAARRAANITIRNGSKIVSNMEVSLLNYLRKCNYNGSNPNRKPGSAAIFFENVPGERSKEFLQKDKDRVEIQYKIHNMSASDLEVMAYNIGIAQASSKMTEDLRRDVLVMCTNKPHLYEQVQNDFDRARIRHTIMLAKEMGELKLHHNKVILKGGKQVFECDFGLDLVDEFTTYCASNSGKHVYGAIFKQVKPFEKIGDVADTSTEEEPSVDLKLNNDYDAEDVFHDALESGVIIKSGRQFFYSTKSGKDELLGGTKSFAIKELKGNKELLEEVASRI